jgi:hypothetical protein
MRWGSRLIPVLGGKCYNIGVAGDAVNQGSKEPRIALV